MKILDATGSDNFVWPKSTLLIATGMVLTHQWLPLSVWVFDRAQIESGSYWSLLSGHFVHSDVQHLIWNLVALVLLGAVIERRSVTIFWTSLLFSIGVVDVGLYWAMPWLNQYCGLSAVLNTLWVVALGLIWRETRSWIVPLLGLAGLCKLTVEMSNHTAIFTDTAWPPLAESHLAGQIAGLLILGMLAAQKSIVANTIIGETS